MSDELEALDALFDFIKNESEEELYENYYNEIKKALKALEIIKEKGILYVFRDPRDSYYLCFNNAAIEIPEKEYELLKEVLS